MMAPAAAVDRRVLQAANAKLQAHQGLTYLTQPLVPAPHSPCSRSTTDSPRSERSRAMPAPVTPPPMTTTSWAEGWLTREILVAPSSPLTPLPQGEGACACVD